ncbi:hypothetical protein MAR_004135 [Mya arenaria]|uniref:Uncharacterized protein n=1 Tax=Mya arenaria TaxID=6604 RepID=A0ABY7EVP7_MYAAR|nr:hypothetical protein MAR_004135 [Mya arenaria]
MKKSCSANNRQQVPSRTRQAESATGDTMVHYSFDYAQQVLYPHYAQQVGKLFFKTPRKCGCFGVCCESSGTQILYLLDESVGKSVGKGANSVKWRASNGETLEEVADTVRKSFWGGYNIPHLVNDPAKPVIDDRKY